MYVLPRLKEKEKFLAEKDRAVWSLESDIVGLQGRCTIIQHEFTRIRELETVRHNLGETIFGKIYSIHFFF